MTVSYGADDRAEAAQGQAPPQYPDDTRRKLDAMLAAKKAEQAKPSGSALVWKDRGVRDASRGERHGHEVNAGQGIYTITPSAAFPSLTFAGYDVAYRATGATAGQRREDRREGQGHRPGRS